MLNFHGVMNNPLLSMRKDKRLQLKNFFQTIPNTVFDKAIHYNYFFNCFSHKVWEKSFLGWNIGPTQKI